MHRRRDNIDYTPSLGVVSIVVCSVISCNAVLGIEEGRLPANAGAAGGEAGTSANVSGAAGNSQGGAAGNLPTGGTAGSTGNGGSAALGPIEVVIPIEADQDDCTWINGTDERLHYSPSEPFIEVGSDSEAGRVGLRFKVPVPRGAKIISAIVRMQRDGGEANTTDTVKYRIFDSATVPAFDDAHTHTPEEHAPLWPTEVGNIWVGEKGKSFDSSELKALVEHVVNRSDWQENGTLGFVVSADSMPDRWVSFVDRASGSGYASLRITYTHP